MFQTPPLTGDMELTGRLIVKLWAASDSPDTDFTAKLIDVYPPSKDFPSGFDVNVGDSIVRARYRNDLAKAELLKTGTVYPLRIHASKCTQPRCRQARSHVSGSISPAATSRVST